MGITLAELLTDWMNTNQLSSAAAAALVRKHETGERVKRQHIEIVMKGEVLAISAFSTPRRIEKVVRAELVYLVAAAQIKADRARAATPSA